MNNTLVTLILDFNRSLGSEGIENLCRGLCTNSTLKKLSVKFCGIDQNGGDPLAEMLLFSKLSLTILELGGNQLGGEGLLRICHGLAQNSSLTNLGLSDNQIWGPRDEKSLSTFAFCVSKHPRLKEINLLYNLIEERGAVALKPAVEGAENQRIEKFLLDASNIPDGLYQQLYRNKVPTKKKVAKKKKKGVKTKK
jgi:Ran GTPase-activating protein (RanGAP) involved in mRNA processing and transport